MNNTVVILLSRCMKRIASFIHGRWLRSLSAVFLCGIMATPALADVALSNTMADHGSPYLRLHKDDPVAWQQWDARVMQRARQQNKMVFVSIGYFSCHWCHVMQRESYSNEAIADQLNNHFIPVKVDRELNPALDAYLIEFVERTRGHAGWPLNVIISPEGYPVVGFTYLPKKEFSNLLQQTLQLWQKNGDFIKEMSRNAAREMRADKQVTKNPVTPALAETLATKFVQHALQFADDMSGGFGDQSKFPMTPQLLMLLQQYEQRPREPLSDFLQLTLDQMATQGLRDHIGGGFFRYTVDPTWQTPHFEKMLYDNAMLALVYLRAATVLQRPDYHGVARETLRFMIRELQSDEGAMVSSLSAVDSNDIEGGYYLWDRATLKTLLDKQEYEVLHLLWSLDNAPQFDAGYLPRHAVSPDDIANKLGVTVSKVMAIIGRAQGKLFQARQQRAIPVDTKQLAGWNGLALHALSEAARVYTDKDPAAAAQFKTAARQIRDYLVNRLWDGKTLLRATADSGSMGGALLEDYAFAAQGLWAWYQVTGDKQDRKRVEQWLQIAWQRFYGETGWQHTDRPLLPGDFGNAVIEDAPLPSASAAIVSLSRQLNRQGNQGVFKNNVTEALKAGHDVLQSNPFYYPGQIAALLAYVSAQTPPRN
ncbi:MAG: DUF255 domain-containing protein [Gammaproteobacteria bacterium]